jgi:hypothetical protein
LFQAVFGGGGVDDVAAAVTDGRDGGGEGGGAGRVRHAEPVRVRGRGLRRGRADVAVSGVQPRRFNLRPKVTAALPSSVELSDTLLFGVLASGCLPDSGALVCFGWVVAHIRNVIFSGVFLVSRRNWSDCEMVQQFTELPLKFSIFRSLVEL